MEHVLICVICGLPLLSRYAPSGRYQRISENLTGRPSQIGDHVADVPSNRNLPEAAEALSRAGRDELLPGHSPIRAKRGS